MAEERSQEETPMASAETNPETVEESDTKNGESAQESSEVSETPQAPEEPKEPTELDKYWKAVKENPSDFTGWTYLLQYVEQEDDIEAARTAFDAFFLRYPYCYGYWKKYADMEKKHSNEDDAEKVFNRGTQSVALSVDLWMHYLAFAAARHKASPDYQQKLRDVYERAIRAVGSDFRADKLWDQYIDWEKENGNLKRVMVLYDRLIATPTQLYSHHFENLKSFVEANVPKEILSLDEFLKLRSEIVASNPELSVPDEVDAPPGMDDAPPGEDAPPGVDAPPGEEAKSEKDKKAKNDAESKAVREKIIELRSQVYKITEQDVSLRWAYEEGIRRPYFHVKPLERAQIKNWHEYLDFEMENGKHDRIVLLFERCMVACALYEELWLKYARYMEKTEPNQVRKVYHRACSIHLPKKPYIHLAWSAFEESQGHYQLAFDILKRIDKQVPGLLMVAMRRVGLERRKGNHSGAEELFCTYMEAAPSGEERNYFAQKYARYQAKVLGNLDRAKKILNEAIEKDPNNSKLYAQLIDLEFQQSIINEQEMIRLIDQALAAAATPEDKLAFSRRKMQFMEDFGCEVTKLCAVYEEHQKYSKDVVANQKKRKATETTGEDSAEKKAKQEVSANGDASTATTATTAVSHSVDPNAAYYNSHWNYQNYNYPQSSWGNYNSQYYPSQ